MNILTFEYKTLTANFSKKNGDGVKNITGHRTSYVFAYAEHCGYGSIFVRNYPNFDLLLRLTDVPERGLSNLIFADVSYLITLANVPDCVISVYNWRNGEKLAAAPGNIFVIEQKLRCTWSAPMHFAQLTRNSKILTIWDVIRCCKSTVLRKHDASIDESVASLCDIFYFSDNTLFCVDKKGNVYTVNNEDRLELIIKEDIEGPYETCLAWYKAGLVVSGPTKELRHYKKVSQWKCDWTMALEFGLDDLKCFRNDCLIAVTVEETIIKITSPEEEVTKVHPRLRAHTFTDFCMIYPAGEYIAVLLRNNELMTVKVENGFYIGDFTLFQNVVAMKENPEYPYLVIGYEHGYIDLISVYNPKVISRMISLKLHTIAMKSIKFFESGKLFIAGNSDFGKFFVIEGLPGSQINIVAFIDVGVQVIDYILVASKTCYRLFSLPVVAKTLTSNKIIRHCILNKDTINVKEYFCEDKNTMYYKLVPTDKADRDRVFYGLSISSRRIHILETRRGDSMVRKIGEIKTGHQVRKLNLNIDKYHALTWGIDGFIFARSKDFKKQVAMALPHHVNRMGVLKAFIDPSGKYIISLGNEMNLVCTDVVENSLNEQLMEEIKEYMESEKMVLMFKRPTLGYDLGREYEGKTWLEVQEMLKVKKEERLCKYEKQKILQNFAEIQSILVSLVTANLEGPDNKKIDLTEFYLDTSSYNKMKNINRDDCKNTETYMKALIVAQDKVSDFLKKNLLEGMAVPGKVIKGIFSNTVVSNYVLLPRFKTHADSKNEEEEIAWILEYRKVQQTVGDPYKFKPWIVMDEDTLHQSLTKPLHLVLRDYGLLDKDFLEGAGTTISDSQIAISGCITQLLIERLPIHYPQTDLVTFSQRSLEQIVADKDVFKLKQFFNKAFDQLMEDKYNEMDNVKKKHDRLRTIISEYNYFSQNKIKLFIEDPEWSQEEQPWLITKVLDNEVAVTPYISPSEQAILDAKAAEEERIRLALLADDFRERALMAMMNGVLEIRWEDELKKDVPLPRCMIDKDPMDFNEDDLRAVKDYEDKVAFLNSERERYKNLLDAEFTKLSATVRDSIRRFNSKVKDCFMLKIQVDSAYHQERYIVNRMILYQHKRVDLRNKEIEMKKFIAKDENAIEQLTKLIHTLNEVLTECRGNIDTFQSKEKMLDKSFKKEFQDFSPVVQEQSVKLYKKRPKLSYRSFTSATVLMDMAKCLTSQEKFSLLPVEAQEYLKAVDYMDVYTGLPQTIDEQTFNLISKHRRLRVEFEIKLRALQVMVNAGDASIAEVQKMVNSLKESITKRLEVIDSVNNDYLYLMHNRQIQLVLRSGIVEIPLTGDLEDFKDAILVPKKDIDEVNHLIKSTGEKKLATIRHNMAFRRNIMATEWEHQRLKMLITDLSEQIRDVNNVKFTKEMQNYLKNKALGRNVNMDSYETEIEILTNTFITVIKDKTEKCKKLNKQVEHYKKNNEILDRQILNINMDLCSLRLEEDKDLEERERRAFKGRTRALLRKNNLIKQIQKNHHEILVLQTELELLRQRTYPTFKYKVINCED